MLDLNNKITKINYASRQLTWQAGYINLSGVIEYYGCQHLYSN